MKITQYNVRILLVGLFAGLFFSGCENELDIAADWKEVAIVYGALSPTDSVHYIRIQRVYLDEKRGALEFSQISDSLYFDSLQVELNEFENGQLINTYPLSRIDGNLIGREKDSGVFANDVNYLYTTNATLKASNFFNNYSYRIDIENPRTGYKAFAETISVGQAEVSAPINKVIDKLVILHGGGHSILVKYQEGKHVRSYDVIMDVNIQEVNKQDSTIKKDITLSWPISLGRETRSLNGYATEPFLIPSESFFNFISASLSQDTTVYRRLVDYDMFFYGITDDLYTYINVNEPSIGIVQKKPEFSNVENGLGIFATRYINKFYDNGFDEATRSSLTQHEATKDLGFVLF